MVKFSQLACCAALLSVTACASIVTGSSQTITVASAPSGAKCEVSRDGSAVQSGTTPMSFSLSKTRSDLSISCEDSVGAKGTGTSKSGVEPWVVGNILLGGLIGLIIDLSSGAHNKYDTPVTVTLTSPPPPQPVNAPKATGKPIS